jgi:hypothetical protein
MRLRTHPDVDGGRLSFVPAVEVREPGGVADSGVEVTVGGVSVLLQRGFCEDTLCRTVAALRRLQC